MLGWLKENSDSKKFRELQLKVLKPQNPGPGESLSVGFLSSSSLGETEKRLHGHPQEEKAVERVLRLATSH